MVTNEKSHRNKAFAEATKIISNLTWHHCFQGKTALRILLIINLLNKENCPVDSFSMYEVQIKLRNAMGINLPIGWIRISFHVLIDYDLITGSMENELVKITAKGIGISSKIIELSGHDNKCTEILQFTTN